MCNSMEYAVRKIEKFRAESAHNYTLLSRIVCAKNRMCNSMEYVVRKIEKFRAESAHNYTAAFCVKYRRVESGTFSVRYWYFAKLITRMAGSTLLEFLNSNLPRNSEL